MSQEDKGNTRDLRDQSQGAWSRPKLIKKMSKTRIAPRLGFCSGAALEQKRSSRPGVAALLGSGAVLVVGLWYFMPSQVARATTSVVDADADAKSSSNEPAAPAAFVGSCRGACGGPAPGRRCWCDPRCKRYGDCCRDYDKYCSNLCGGSSGRKCVTGEYCLYPFADRCGDAGTTGICAPAQKNCPSYTMYVCGCNGQTYQNPCWAHKSGQAIRHYGPCKSVDPQKSCKGRCGTSSRDNSCYCDVNCGKWNDCCEDFAKEC